jgi:hypothetical protein
MRSTVQAGGAAVSDLEIASALRAMTFKTGSNVLRAMRGSV